MYNQRPCGRPIHDAPPGVDEAPVCLMHSRDEAKSAREFREEFERILTRASGGVADFTGFVFQETEFGFKGFYVKCIFSGATFAQKASFVRARFEQEADFRQAIFAQRAGFGGAWFSQDANFEYAKFRNEADFFSTWFYGKAKFSACRFDGDMDFSGCIFKTKADFSDTWIACRATFSGTEFGRVLMGQRNAPSPIFTKATFETPEKVSFYQTSLVHALFHRCDISKINFSDVTWCKRANGKNMLFEEMVDLEVKDGNTTYSVAVSLAPVKDDPNPRNYRVIAELYQQLKKNYDDRRDYWTAGDFHYGEMEMKRLHSDHDNQAVRWLHRNLGLVAWYKYASDYGESYVKPALWLMAILMVFTFLYPWKGLCTEIKAGKPTGDLVHCDPEKIEVAYGDGVSRLRSVVGHGAMTSLYVAAFQKDLTYQPSYPWGRLLALVEVLLTSALGALFLLAVRRQFKR
jgi:uncharacterized protein YjbI with pentapeptide repeats